MTLFLLFACHVDRTTDRTADGYGFEVSDPRTDFTPHEREEDIGDTGNPTQDTDTTIETGDTSASTNCTFELVASGNGRIEVSNELQFSLSSLSPSGSGVPSYQEVFIFNIASLHTECGDVTADTASLEIFASDNNGGETHWAVGVEVAMVDLTVDPTAAIMTGTTDMNSTDNIYGPLSGTLTVPAGEAHTFAVYMDTNGASASQDDTLKLKLRRYMHIVDTPETAAAVMMDEEIEGGTLTF